MEKETKNKWLKRAIMSASLFVATSFGFNANAQTAKTSAPKAKANVTNVQKVKTSSAKQRTFSIQKRLKEQKEAKAMLDSLNKAFSESILLEHHNFDAELLKVQQPTPLQQMFKVNDKEKLPTLSAEDLSAQDLTIRPDTGIVFEVDKDIICFETGIIKDKKTGKDKQFFKSVYAKRKNPVSGKTERAYFKSVEEERQETPGMTSADILAMASELAQVSRDIDDGKLPSNTFNNTVRYLINKTFKAAETSSHYPFNPKLSQNIKYQTKVITKDGKEDVLTMESEYHACQTVNNVKARVNLYNSQQATQLMASTNNMGGQIIR